LEKFKQPLSKDLINCWSFYRV